MQKAIAAQRRRAQAAELEAWVRKAYGSFRADLRTVESAIESATKAESENSGYSLEIYPDGTHRVFWSDRIGNLYTSPGFIIHLPTLGEEEWDENEDDGHFYDNAIEALDEVIEDLIAEQKEYILEKL